jgi:hypothetical protein
MNLYEISTEVRSILSQETEDGELPADLAERLSSLSVSTAEKVGYLCQFREELAADAIATKAVIDRLQARKAALESRAEWLKKYILQSMQTQGIRRLDTAHHKLWIQNNPPAARLREGAEIPQEFSKIKVEFNGAAALEAHRRGVKLPETISIEQGEHLRIK